MVIFISGATAGFGAAMARRFIKDKNLVIGTGRREDRLKILKEELGENFLGLPLDVRNQNEVNLAIKNLPLKFSAIDVLINNAGLALGMNPVQEGKAEDWDVMVDTNIKGVLHLTAALLPQMVSRNRGHVVNMGSVAGEFPYPGGNIYGATKAFVHQLSLNMRADLLGTEVRVTCVEPGLCGDTEFSIVRHKGDQSKAKAPYEGVKYLRPEDVAETVSWVITRPPHMNINVISLMPVAQAFGPFAINRKT
jgi:3-hydroxy acid dehydrogenase / malonic semialdehyde reductase